MLLMVPLSTVYSYVYKFSTFIQLNSVIWMSRISKLFFFILVREDFSYDIKLRETTNRIFII